MADVRDSPPATAYGSELNSLTSGNGGNGGKAQKATSEHPLDISREHMLTVCHFFLGIFTFQLVLGLVIGFKDGLEIPTGHTIPACLGWLMADLAVQLLILVALAYFERYLELRICAAIYAFGQLVLGGIVLHLGFLPAWTLFFMAIFPLVIWLMVTIDLLSELYGSESTTSLVDGLVGAIL